MHGALSLSAVSRVLAMAEFKLVYRGPAREGYKVTTTNAGRLLHRSRNQFVVNHSRGLPKIGNKVASSYNAVTWKCAFVLFSFLFLETLLRDVMAEFHHADSCTAKISCFENTTLAFVRIYPFGCAKFINFAIKWLVWPLGDKGECTMHVGFEHCSFENRK